ncbi:GCN5-related N-acetyltransferase [Pseudarthrobacter chlorophenolicus A6]|uniref:GCN5-related N-acetyltransferase n=1 Tax=Pseudarthrobacter chlorophenolicus (strain ATCC 700700 / DSM 12829 / CIP 107037 / JCM 12360 / KCTC 9906 / NCIMB 13794 / A6) TaxID=452863 RepID=B8HGL9_PSECP|nr:GNAT family N-acetyltransferase [Pseudarthrobacter chlorophenolicus]ACL41285.1 GCN5-related N-acetyltransferase [Pseudarthrobacter chlorophenolicus A6]SDQ66971.1 putative acetyltransferase [Pseudarthrobacter chlorophenolicus]
MIKIDRDDPVRGDVHQLLSEHLADMFATSPAESVHALDHTALSVPSITFWTAREDGELLGCGALKLLDVDAGPDVGASELHSTAVHGSEPHGAGRLGEIKSMRTAAAARGRGVATLMLKHIIEQARSQELKRIYLETGTEDYFAPARRLYARHGFTECPPFADYVLDPNSVFMELRL